MSAPKCLGLICREPKYCADMGECCRMVGPASEATTPPIVSITDELIAELESELEKNDGTGICMSDSEMRALLAERAELKRDAERYRWLRDGAQNCPLECPVVVIADEFASNVSNDLVFGDDLDAAIDAAMQL